MASKHVLDTPKEKRDKRNAVIKEKVEKNIWNSRNPTNEAHFTRQIINMIVRRQDIIDDLQRDLQEKIKECQRLKNDAALEKLY